MVPRRVVHDGTGVSVEQQVVVDLVDHLPFGPHRVRHLQQQRTQHMFRRNRGTPRIPIQNIKRRAKREQDLIRQLANRTQRMIPRNPQLQRNMLYSAS